MGVNQFERYIKRVPGSARKVVAHYPGKSPEMVDSGAIIGGGALGSAVALGTYGAISGSTVGPIGTVVIGGGGAVLGAIGGQAVVDFFTPGEDPYPAQVEQMKPYTAVDLSDSAEGGR